MILLYTCKFLFYLFVQIRIYLFIYSLSFQLLKIIFVLADSIIFVALIFIKISAHFRIFINFTAHIYTYSAYIQLKKTALLY